MIPLRRKVLWWAVYSRGFVITLQTISNLLLPDHVPTEAAFQWTPIELKAATGARFSKSAPPDPAAETVLDRFVDFAFDGLLRWDAQHFLHVANNGYTFEKNLAFFPLYPLAVQTLAKAALWLLGGLGLIGYVSLLKVSAVAVNFGAFVLLADVYYALSRRVLRDEYLAYKSALLFCVNPASVFFSAAYSETLFALFAFSAVLALERGHALRAGGFLALASITRSNGIVNVGFVVYHSMKTVATETILFVRSRKKAKKGRLQENGHGHARGIDSPLGHTVEDKAKNGHIAEEDPIAILWRIASGTLVPGMINILLAVTPFAAFQWYAFNTFCRMATEDVDLAPAVLRAAQLDPSELKLPGAGNRSSWCSDDPPVSYTYVQSAYWGVGWLRFWEAKNWPLLAVAMTLPMIAMVAAQAYCFVSAHPRYATRLGLVDNSRLGLPTPKDLPKTATLSLPRECLVYIAHAAFLSAFSLTCMHIHVATRLIMSSSPVVCWIAALATTPSESRFVPISEADLDSKAETTKAAEDEKGRRERERRLWFSVEKAKNLDARHSTVLLQEDSDSALANAVKLYFFGYTFLGTVCFANNLPWT